MKKISLIFIVLFSLLIIDTKKYECYVSEKAFTNIENTILSSNEFVQNGVKMEYIVENSIKDEKERFASFLIENDIIKINEKDNTVIIFDGFFKYEVKFIDGSKTKVEIVLINDVNEYSTRELRQAIEKFKADRCEEIRYYYFSKTKINYENKINSSAILSELNENTIEEARISNGNVFKGTLKDGNKINIGQIKYDTGEYLIIGTPVIFITY